jgi:S1-C subfamily serine protease
VINDPGGVSDAGILVRMLGIQAVEWEQNGEEEGAQITTVVPDGVANSAGLEPGNVITDVDRKRVRTPLELASQLAKRSPGSRIRLGYMFKSFAMGWMPKETLITLSERN